MPAAAASTLRRHWSREAAFRELQDVLADVVAAGVGRTVREEHA